MAWADDSTVREVTANYPASTEQSADVDECLRASDGPVDDQAATVYRCRARVGVVAGHGLRSRPHLSQATQAADHSGKVRVGIVIAGNKRACAQRDAASTHQRADRLSKIIQVKGTSGGHRERGLKGKSVNRPSP